MAGDTTRSPLQDFSALDDFRRLRLSIRAFGGVREEVWRERRGEVLKLVDGVDGEAGGHDGDDVDGIKFSQQAFLSLGRREPWWKEAAVAYWHWTRNRRRKQKEEASSSVSFIYGDRHCAWNGHWTHISLFPGRDR